MAPVDLSGLGRLGDGQKGSCPTSPVFVLPWPSTHTVIRHTVPTPHSEGTAHDSADTV